MSFFDDVGEFHAKFSQPYFGDGRPPEFLTEDRLAFRLGFIAEEFSEFCIAHSKKDMAACADAIADMVYVLLGTAHYMGLPFNDIWTEVQRANMAKTRAEGSGVCDKIVKPDGWVGPSHDNALYVARQRTIRHPRGLLPL